MSPDSTDITSIFGSISLLCYWYFKGGERATIDITFTGTCHEVDKNGYYVYRLLSTIAVPFHQGSWFHQFGKKKKKWSPESLWFTVRPVKPRTGHLDVEVMTIPQSCNSRRRGGATAISGSIELSRSPKLGLGASRTFSWTESNDAVRVLNHVDKYDGEAKWKYAFEKSFLSLAVFANSSKEWCSAPRTAKPSASRLSSS
jgi:hypothetical protein